MKFLPAIAILLPFPAAGEPAFERTTIRLFEQADGPILPVVRRLYSTHFDATRMRMLVVEVPATDPLTCMLTGPDGSRSLPEEKTESHGTNLLWGIAADPAWKPGRYEVECLAGEKSLGKAPFEIALNPPELEDGAIRVAAMRIFPVEENLPPRIERKYTSTLAAESTKRIGIELDFSHPALERSARVPVECYFFWPDGQTSPPVILSYEPEPTWAGGYSAGAMGWEQPGNWAKGVYTITCAIYGQPVAVERIDLT